jgi:nitrate/TMAO reductase-like tetraheme cytochrome c subunit
MSIREFLAKPHMRIFGNWISLAGLVIAVGSFFSFIFLFVLDMLSSSHNPYVGILNYLVAPTFLVIGVVTMMVGAVLRRLPRFRRADGTAGIFFTIDFTRRKDRRNLVLFISGTFGFLLLSAVGSYQTYHFTESVGFCGETCHSVMSPEFTSYLTSPHARVSCAACHIGSGASWYVKSKIRGAYQVYATAFDKFERPIPTPISNLRPAQETCEQCHWPQNFSGNLERIYDHFLADEENTAFTVRLLLKVGGGDPTHGPVGGIHWHMNVANTIEYVATDEKNQEIPWVRMIDPQGVVTEYRREGFTDDPAKYRIHKMDCHNRPAHNFKSPNDAIDLALSIGALDKSIPGIKEQAVAALTGEYQNAEDALQKIATTFRNHYLGDPRVSGAIDTVQDVYQANFFPEMKADWSVYPDNIGHKDWPGCFRCHDGGLASSDGRLKIKADDCNACHLILAQRSGPQLDELAPRGLAFEHPAGDVEDWLCHECHNGELQW